MNKLNIERSLTEQVNEARNSNDERRENVAEAIANSGLVGVELERSEDVEAMRRLQALAAAKTEEQVL